jgi:hypothetical protein
VTFFTFFSYIWLYVEKKYSFKPGTWPTCDLGGWRGGCDAHPGQVCDGAEPVRLFYIFLANLA